MLEKIACLNVTVHLKYFIIGLLNGTATIKNLPSFFKLLVSQAYNFFKSHPRIFNLTASSEKNTHRETYTSILLKSWLTRNYTSTKLLKETYFFETLLFYTNKFCFHIGGERNSFTYIPIEKKANKTIF